MLSQNVFLYVSNSPYNSYFIFKGGRLLAKHVELGGETHDLDFSVERLSNKVNVLKDVLNNIIKFEINDGFFFENLMIAPLEHFHMQYPGAQVKINVRFGKAKFLLLIDHGFGDLVQTHEHEIKLLSYRTPRANSK